MVCRTLEIGVGKKQEVRSEESGFDQGSSPRQGESLGINGHLINTDEGNKKMRDQFGAVAFNLRTALRRLEDLRQEADREISKGLKDNVYEVKVSVNNLANVLKVADENLRELEELIKAVKVKRKTGDASTGSAGQGGKRKG